MLRSRLVAGVAVATAVGIGGVGGALIGVPGLSGAQTFPKSAVPIAATDANKPNRLGKGSPLLDAAAKALKLTTLQLRTKLSDGKTTIADVAKQQNVDINTVITAMTNADRARIGDIVNKPWPTFAAGGHGNGFGPARGFGGPFDRFGANSLDSVANALGISAADLKADLAKGQTIAQIANAKKLDVNTVIDKLVADASKRIDKAVTDGDLTTAQADKLKAALKTEITTFVNDGFPKGPKSGFGFRGRGHDGPPDFGSKPATTPSTKAPTA